MKIQAFDFSVNLMRALLWQYNDALRLQAILQAKQDWYNVNQSGFWVNWYDDIFNLQTANDFGLAVWAIILGLPLAVAPSTSEDQDIFGFASDDFNFGNGNFAANGTTIVLTTEQKRLVLKLRYYQLTTRHSVTQANAILKAVFGDGAAYVVDSLLMKIRYVFAVAPAPQVQFILTNYDLLPRPAGVKADYIVQGEADGFGFGAFHENFNNGNFYHG
jgi:hypothetical protein